jgi:polyvinyl alcohol dehydrogenase (cytochrome)
VTRNVAWLGVVSFCWIGALLCWNAALPEARGQQAEPAPAAGAPPAAGRGAAAPGTESGLATFQTRCTICHANSVSERKGVRGAETAPTTDVIRQMSPERIYQALTTGSMQEHARDLPDVAKVRLAEFMSSRPMGSARSGDAAAMPNRCTANPPLSDPGKSPSWNGWGNDLSNTRFQPAAAARLTAAQVPQLKLKWAFGYPAGVSANAQPAIVSGRVFVGSDNGYVYSLDAGTGCVYWSFENGSIIRNAPVVAPILLSPGRTGLPARASGPARVTGPAQAPPAAPAQYAVFFGDGHANVYALDAHSGKQLWKTRVDSHFVARITAGVKYYDGKLFVPVSSSEEVNSGNPSYSCCTARGSVVALDANTGRQIWKAWVIPNEPRAYKTMANGVVLYRPAGGAVWNSPTVDPLANAVYFGTGDATTAPSPPTTDAVMAVDIDTGKLLWSYQATTNDVFMGGCTGAERSDACPTPLGPDMDIGNSPMLVALPGGRRALLGGTKSADVFALDPDKNGALLYRTNAAGGPINVSGRAARGAIVWGGAADGQQVYYGAAQAGLVAIKPADGQIVWTFRAPPLEAGGRGTASLGAAPTAIPGVVFQGALDGRLFAVSSTDGKLIWQFNTAQEFKTINGVMASGGAIASAGAVVVDGMVYVGSGYGFNTGAQAGNVLLAFGIE